MPNTHAHAHAIHSATAQIAKLDRVEMFSLVLHLADDLASVLQDASGKRLDTEQHQLFAMEQIFSRIQSAVEFARDTLRDALDDADNAHH